MTPLFDAVARMLRPLERRIRSLATACTITAVTDTGAAQTVQITLLAGERLSNAIRLQPYGHSANPPAGAVGLAISVGGSRSHVLVLGGEDASRPTGLPGGATQIYDEVGSYVRLNNDGTMTAYSAVKVTLQAPAGEATGNWTFDGTTHFKGAVTGDQSAAFTGALSSATSVADPNGTMQGMRSVFNGHDHGGIQTGSGTSLGPNEYM